MDYSNHSRLLFELKKKKKQQQNNTRYSGAFFVIFVS